MPVNITLTGPGFAIDRDAGPRGNLKLEPHWRRRPGRAGPID
jgi:hypothetical protein